MIEDWHPKPQPSLVSGDPNRARMSAAGDLPWRLQLMVLIKCVLIASYIAACILRVVSAAQEVAARFAR